MNLVNKIIILRGVDFFIFCLFGKKTEKEIYLKNLYENLAKKLNIMYNLYE
jgi:hypothetical protein